MASSFEKSVKGATKIKAAPPKTKYIEHILVATHAGEAGVGEVFRALSYRLHDSTWTVVFKSLITMHLMIREGSPDATLAYLSRHRNMLAISSFTDAQIQGRNIKNYAAYISERARAYKDTKVDWVRTDETRLEKLAVDKGLLRETEAVQRQVSALVKCDVMDEPENEITVTVFRLLVLDLLPLFQVLNQAMINILGHFFEMSKTDAERAMEIYRDFTKQTDHVVQFLSVARQFEHHTRVEVPKLKHAPVNLGRQLEEYLKDPDFEVHRRQYLAELDAKKKGGGSTAPSSAAASSSRSTAKATGLAFPSTNGSSAPSTSKAAVTKGPDPDLIDFFDSIEQNQTTMTVNAQQQPQPQAPQQMPWGSSGPFNTVQQTAQQPFHSNGFVPAQQTGFVNNSPYQQQQVPQQQQMPPQPLQTNFTGAGFGGYTPQPPQQQQQAFTPGGLGSIPQDSVANFQNPLSAQSLQTGQNTNPFRQSMMMASPTGSTMSPVQQNLASQPTSDLQRRMSTNPFARPQTSASSSPFNNSTNNSPFQSAMPTGAVVNTGSPFQSQPPVAAAPAPLLPAPTGTNPFARNFTGSQPQVQQQQQQQQPQPRPQTSGGLVPQATGATNPFRQGAFVNHQTGMGWQHEQQRMGGGMDQLETVPVFPRPATGSAWQQ